MLDTKDFAISDKQISFDFKGFLIKVGSYWKWFVLGLIIAFTIAYQVNIRKQKIYGAEATIVLKEETNPFFTSNTSLIFNWGGSSDQVQSLMSILRSRTHNEKVVDKMEYYVDYLVQGKYYRIDAYGETPFKVKIVKNKPQILGMIVNIKFLSDSDFELKIKFPSDNVSLYRYSDNTISKTNVEKGEFIKKYKLGEAINLPFLNIKLETVGNPGSYIGKEYMFKFNDFNATVSQYRRIKITTDDKSPSILKLSIDGNNKERLVDYLNNTAGILIKNQLDYKNQFAKNTIQFIDSTMAAMEIQIKSTANELKDFGKNNNVLQLEEGGSSSMTEKLSALDAKKDEITRKIQYYNSLRNYLRSSTDFSKLPAPSVAGIDDPNIVVNVGQMIQLSRERAELAYTVKNDKIFKDFDNKTEALKNVLFENINTAKSSLQDDLAHTNSALSALEGNLKKLPEDKQEYLKIVRKYNLSDGIYNNFLQKRSEATIVKAANVSDIKFIDNAKETDVKLVGPRTDVNYVSAFFLGLLIPLFIVFIIFFLNSAIHNTDDIGALTKLPIIGVIGLKHNKSNLSVFEKPKSALAESFRSIRSSLQFLYKKQKIQGSKILMLTSSISGEGKTFCSINLATVFALGEKKTVLIGLDLRKPKLVEDFNINNDKGVVNYLIGQSTLSDIVQKTEIPFLDVITSGPIPPNPSELLLGESMKEFIDELKLIYDYIILDTPPVGLVADALELVQYCDITLYVVRQNYTRKDMITLLNNRSQRGELNNVSIVMNGYENKARYGTDYGYGYSYGYGYGAYSNGYHEEEKPKTIFEKIKDIFLLNNLFNKP